MGGPQRRAGIPPTVRTLRLHPFQGLGRPYNPVVLAKRPFSPCPDRECKPAGEPVGELFSYTKFAKNHIENVLGGNLTGD
jgi:hypothetical protein